MPFVRYDLAITWQAGKRLGIGLGRLRVLMGGERVLLWHNGASAACARSPGSCRPPVWA
jgi:hypothetical protein